MTLAAILYFDHILTFGDEITFVWDARSKAPIKVLFLVMHYLSFFGNIPLAVFRFTELGPSVSKTQFYFKNEVKFIQPCLLSRG